MQEAQLSSFVFGLIVSFNVFFWLHRGFVNLFKISEKLADIANMRNFNR